MIAILSRMLPVAAVVLLACFAPSSAQVRRVNNPSESKVKTVSRILEFDEVDQKPVFPGGNDKILSFINENRQYPREAYEKGIQGRVTCAFIVNTDGSVSDVSLLRRANEMLNQEAIRIFQSMPRWSPGRHEGRPVRVTQSVTFRR